MIPANFDYQSPVSLSEALSLLAANEDAKILAGGHSLLPAMKLRLAQPAMLIDIGRIGGLDYIRESGNVIRIGALTTHAEIASSALLREQSPLLALAASQIGDTQVRNRGTIGGSLAQAHPAADYPAAVLALDAEIVVHSRTGERKIAARDFFTGMFSTALEHGEIITEINVPKTTGEKVAYHKHHHPASGFAVVGVAVRLKISSQKIDSAAVALTGVGTHPYRASKVEDALQGKPAGKETSAAAAAHVVDGVEALGDPYASADYRLHLAQVMTRRTLMEAVKK